MSSPSCSVLHDGVEYFEIEGAQGTYFSCPRGLGRFSVAHCARMHTEAHSARGMRDGVRTTCRGCAVGAAHRGVPEVPRSRWAGAQSCARCHRLATRLIRGAVCLSCYNREREVLAWRNRKGGPPRLCPAIGAVHLAVGGMPQRTELVADALEAVILALRRQPGAGLGWSGMVVFRD